MNSASAIVRIIGVLSVPIASTFAFQSASPSAHYYHLPLSIRPHQESSKHPKNIISSSSRTSTKSPCRHIFMSMSSSWEEIIQSHPSIQSSLKTPRPVYHNSLPPELLDEGTIDKPILYRDANCICAASQMVWLGLECKNVDYVTVLVDKQFDLRGSDDNNDDDGSSGTQQQSDTENETIPRIVWPNNNNDNNNDNNDKDSKQTTITSDPIKLLEQIQSHYPDTPPNFYPKLSAAVDASRCNILRFPGVMPRLSDPNYMSHAPLLFRPDGTLVPKSSHCVSLEELEEMLEEYYLGPYLCGKDVTAADIAWIPYLERYAAQLPLVFPKINVLNPRSKDAYGEVHEWYLTLERYVAPYACAVMGDARHWRKCLEEVVELHNDRAKSEEEMVKSLAPPPKRNGWWMKKNPRGEELWKEYVENRPWLGDTPGREVALYLIRNREEIVRDACEEDNAIIIMEKEEVDEALREVVQRLIDGKDEDDESCDLSEKARQLVQFVGERLKVPKDLGMVPALALWELIQ